jgi:putative ABC transport system permease protein
MIKFLLKGILRDRSRSVLPVIIISLGVMLTVLLSGYIRGVMGDIINQNARLETGHVKVMTRAYLENKSQLPNDLALLGIEELISQLQSQFSTVSWEKRIRFGGLIDAPDENGLTKGQGPAVGMALDILTTETKEIVRLNLRKSLVTGAIPVTKGEALISDDFAKKLDIEIGDEVTYVGTTMNGSMTFQNFKVSGTILFGSPMMDKGAIVVDITAAQQMLDMADGSSELLGYFPSEKYDDETATEMSEQFNQQYVESTDEFLPVMQSLKQQDNLAGLIDIANMGATLFVTLFIITMSIVLWNTGLLGGLRRYQEFGIRLALGESKTSIYKTLVLEAVLIGIIGSVVGTLLGVGATYYLQEVGIDVSKEMANSTVLLPTVMRAKVSPDLFLIGFIPGVLAMVFGNMLSGIGIYRRETATLFKELEI